MLISNFNLKIKFCRLVTAACSDKELLAFPVANVVVNVKQYIMLQNIRFKHLCSNLIILNACDVTINLEIHNTWYNFLRWSLICRHLLQTPFPSLTNVINIRIGDFMQITITITAMVTMLVLLCLECKISNKCFWYANALNIFFHQVCHLLFFIIIKKNHIQ